MKFFLQLVLNAIAILLIGYLLPGIQINNPYFTLMSAFLLAFINTFIRPVLLFLTFPITIVTLGFFILVINAILFWAALNFTPGIEVSGFGWAFVGMILYSMFSYFLQEMFIDDKDKKES